MSDIAKPEKVGVVVIHGVGETQPGWINDYIVSELEKREPELEFDDHSLVFKLADTGRVRRRVPSDTKVSEPQAPPPNYFRSVIRGARLGGRAEVSFAELYWADISNVGATATDRFLNLIKLFFEAPHTLGESLLQKSVGGTHGTIRRLVLTALWILRWPIAGLQVAIFASAFGYLGLIWFLDLINAPPFLHGWGIDVDAWMPTMLPIVVIGLLGMTAIAGVATARWRANHEAGFTSLGIATATSALALMMLTAILAYLIPHDMIMQVARQLMPEADLVSVGPQNAGEIATYLAIGGWLIIGAWGAWNLCMVSAISLIACVGAFRLLRPQYVSAVSLSRPACAAALAIIQGVLWKLIICPLTILILLVLVKDAGGACSKCSWAVGGFYGVNDILVRMVIIAVLNAGVSLFIGTIFWYQARKRLARVKLDAARLMSLGTALPRLIINPVVLAYLLACNIATVCLYYGLLASDSPTFHYIQDHVTKSGIFTFFRYSTGTFIITLIPYFVAALQEASRGILHIALDVVDHWYTPHVSFLRYIMPGETFSEGVYPRRARVQSRLQTLMQTVIVPRNFDRLVFLTHSQGSVIMHDFLKSQNNKNLLSQFQRVDIVTLASPLSHIYQHYFHNYQTITPSPDTLCTQLASWTNLYRIDDPIGHRVDIIQGDFIANTALPPGGHVNYWKEDQVCETILDVIDSERMKAKAAAIRQAERNLKSRLEAEQALREQRPLLFPELAAAKAMAALELHY